MACVEVDEVQIVLGEPPHIAKQSRLPSIHLLCTMSSGGFVVREESKTDTCL